MISSDSVNQTRHHFLVWVQSSFAEPERFLGDRDLLMYANPRRAAAATVTATPPASSSSLACEEAKEHACPAEVA